MLLCPHKCLIDMICLKLPWRDTTNKLHLKEDISAFWLVISVHPTGCKAGGVALKFREEERMGTSWSCVAV